MILVCGYIGNVSVCPNNIHVKIALEYRDRKTEGGKHENSYICKHSNDQEWIS